MKNNLLDKITELNSLYKCYLIIENSSDLTQDAAVFGKLALYEKMIEVLKSDIVYPIVSKNIQYPFEDSIYHVVDDTPGFLNELNKSLANNQ